MANFAQVCSCALLEIYSIETMITIDGSIGEGGGQVVRSALTLSMLTGQSFNITRIRAARPAPGLRPQHLAAVHAAKTVCHAQVEGDSLGSEWLTFEPGAVAPGEYRFAIGTAGAATLVLQTVLLPLAVAQGPSLLTINGGTHVPWSPSFHYLDLHWRYFMALLGVSFDLSLRWAGFYPQGGGEIMARLPGAARLHAIDVSERGRLRRISGLSAVANLSEQIAERQRSQALLRLKSIAPDIPLTITLESFKAFSRGTLLVLLAEFEASQACFSALGARGKPAERVADEAIDGLVSFLAGDGAVDHWLADQLLLPLAMATGQSRLRTSVVTQHLLTNAAVIRHFIPVAIDIAGPLGSVSLITVGGRNR